MEARALYHNARKFCPMARMLICANALPEIDPEEGRATLVRWRGRTIFVDGALTDKHLTANARFAQGNEVFQYASKDDSIKEYLKTPQAIAAFTHIILNAFIDGGTAYLPATVTDDADADAHITVDMVVGNFLEEGQDEDFVPLLEIKQEVRRIMSQEVTQAKITSAVKCLNGSYTQRGPVNARVPGYKRVRKAAQ